MNHFSDKMGILIPFLFLTPIYTLIFLLRILPNNWFWGSFTIALPFATLIAYCFKKITDQDILYNIVNHLIQHELISASLISLILFFLILENHSFYYANRRKREISTEILDDELGNP